MVRKGEKNGKSANKIEDTGQKNKFSQTVSSSNVSFITPVTKQINFLNFKILTGKMIIMMLPFRTYSITFRY